MIEARSDLWSVLCDARCITTNGTIKSDGTAVMGRGVARQACDRYRGLRRIQGRALAQFGNVPAILVDDPPVLVSFPVKDHWFNWADLTLIRHSAEELVYLATRKDWSRIVLPRPGCNNGHREWEREVAPILRPLLDDRFLVVWQ